MTYPDYSSAVKGTAPRDVGRSNGGKQSLSGRIANTALRPFANFRITLELFETTVRVRKPKTR
jgi:hypothetical protein